MEFRQLVLVAVLFFALFTGLAAAQTSTNNCSILLVGDSLKANNGAYATLKSVTDPTKYAMPSEAPATFAVYDSNGGYAGDYELKPTEFKTVNNVIKITLQGVAPGVGAIIYARACVGNPDSETINFSCNDSDKTLDYYGFSPAQIAAANDSSKYVKGTIIAYGSTGDYYNLTDTCYTMGELQTQNTYTGNQVQEHYCLQGKYYSNIILSCPYGGCRDGACLQATPTFTPVPTATPLAATSTPSITPTAIPTPVVTPTPVATVVATPTPASTATPTPAPTVTPKRVTTSTPTPPTATPKPTVNVISQAVDTFNSAVKSVACFFTQLFGNKC